MKPIAIVFAAAALLTAASAHAVLEKEIEAARIACEKADAASASMCQQHKTLLQMQKNIGATQPRIQPPATASAGAAPKQTGPSVQEMGVPAYPGATLVMARTVAPGSHQYAFDSKDPVEKISAFYVSRSGAEVLQSAANGALLGNKGYPGIRQWDITISRNQGDPVTRINVQKYPGLR